MAGCGGSFSVEAFRLWLRLRLRLRLRACVRACVHACVRACVHACVRACMGEHVHACMPPLRCRRRATQAPHSELRAILPSSIPPPYPTHVPGTDTLVCFEGHRPAPCRLFISGPPTLTRRRYIGHRPFLTCYRSWGPWPIPSFLINLPQFHFPIHTGMSTRYIVRAHTHVCLRSHAHAHLRTRTRTHTCTNACIHTRTHAMHACTCAHVHTRRVHTSGCGLQDSDRAIIIQAITI